MNHPFLNSFLNPGFVYSLYRQAVLGTDYVHSDTLSPTSDVNVVMARVQREARTWPVRVGGKLAIEAESPESKEYAKHVIEQIGNKTDFRREDSAKFYQHKALSKKPPTMAQLRYLARLGFGGSPPDSMESASKLIDTYKQG